MSVIASQMGTIVAGIGEVVVRVVQIGIWVRAEELTVGGIGVGVGGLTLVE